MLLVRKWKSYDVFEQEIVDNGIPGPMDYNPSLESFTTKRIVLTNTGWTLEKIKDFLTRHPEACIYNTLSHQPISEYKVILDGEDYVDQFGLNVYILSQVSWEYHEDVDERFNYERYPDELEQELYDYLTR